MLPYLRKHTNTEVFGFEMKIIVLPHHDPYSLEYRRNIAARAVGSDSLLDKFKNFSGDLYWMDAICID